MGEGSGGAALAATSAGETICTLANQVTSDEITTAAATDNPRVRCLIWVTVPPPDG
jgi:hypothetical protein